VIKSASRSSITNDQKYRSMLAGAVPSNEYLISSTLITENTPSVTFDVSSFAGVYKHLQIVWVGRWSGTAFNRDDLCYRFNGDSGNNYSEHGLSGNGSTVASGATSSFNRGFCGSLSSNLESSGIFGSGVIDILDAYGTKNKVLRTFWGRTGTSPIGVTLQSSMWMNTTSISSLQLFPSSGGNFVAGSRFSLYGVTA
jgi:hypothetical protein